MKKNKIIVFCIGPTILTIMFIIWLSVFVIIHISVKNGNDTMSMVSWMILYAYTIFFLLTLISTYCLFWQVIEFSKQGIKRSLFGIKIKEFRWEEIKFVTKPANYSVGTQWVFLSEKKLNEKYKYFWRIKKDLIYFVDSEKIRTCFKEFAPVGLFEEIYNESKNRNFENNIWDNR